MFWLALLLCCSAALALPLPDEVDSEETRKVLGSSVVTSVSVIMDLGNGTQAVFTNATGDRPEKPGGVGSPVDMATPDHYQYYSFDGSGNLIKRYMTKDDVSSIIATNQKHNSQKTDAPTFYHSVPGNIGDLAFETKDEEDESENLQQSQLRVVANVQNLLKSQISSQGHVRPPMPTHISPETSASWSMILPSFFGNQDPVEENLDQISEETEAKYNETLPSHLNSTEQTLVSSSSSSSSDKPASVTKVESIQSFMASTESTDNADSSTAPSSSSAAHVDLEESSSESQMLGDAPAVSDASTETFNADHSEESTELASKTDSIPTHSTQSHSETDDNKSTTLADLASMTDSKPTHSTQSHSETDDNKSTTLADLTSKTDSESTHSTQSHSETDDTKSTTVAETQHATDSTSDEQSTEHLRETSSTEYEMISTSNEASSQTTSHHTKENTKPTPQDSTIPSVLKKEEDQHSQSSENHYSEIVNNTQSNENLSVSESTPLTSATQDTLSSDSSAMLADSPFVEVIFKHSSTNSKEPEEKVSSTSTEASNESVAQTSIDSKDKEEEEEMIKIPTISVKEDVSQKYEEVVSSSTEQVEKDDKKTVSSTENSSETSHLGDDVEKHSEEEVDSSTDSKENTDNGETPTKSTEIVDTSTEKETSSEEIKNSSKDSTTESAQMNSEENTKSNESLEDTEQPAESVETNVSSTDGEQPTTLGSKKTPADSEHSTSEETTISTEGTTQKGSKPKPIEEHAQADAPYVDKLGENPSSEGYVDKLGDKPSSNVYVDKLGEKPSSDLANTLVISEENHSSFNQVDLSTSSSKESIASKNKNNSISETDPDPAKEDDSKTVDKILLEDNTSSTSSLLKGANSNEVSESVATSSEASSTTDSSKAVDDSLAVSSTEDSSVSASPVTTTDTSSSTPEVTEESGSSEEDSGKVEISSEESSEEDGSGETELTKTTPASSTETIDEMKPPHNLDESVASIVSQITDDNAKNAISQTHHDNSETEDQSNNLDVASPDQGSGDGISDSQENPSTEIVVTSVSTSKSTESSSSEVVTVSKDHLSEEGSGVNGLCSEDASCTEDDSSEISETVHTDNDKVSAGSESVGVTTKFDYHTDNSTSDNLTINDSAIGIDIKVNSTSQSTHGPMYENVKIVTKNHLLQTNSTTKEELGERVVGILTTTVTHLTKTDTELQTTPSILITESGEIIPISEENVGLNKPKIDDTIQVIPSQKNKKVCSKEGSGSDDVTDSCEDEPVIFMDGSGGGPDSTDNSVEGSSESTTNSYINDEFFTTNVYNIGEDKNQISGEDSSTKDNDFDDIMKYASSLKDIGIKNVPHHNNSNETSLSETPVPYHDDLGPTDQQFESSTLNVDTEPASTPDKEATNNKPVHTMDLFEYINSNLDIGITNAYDSSESDTSEPPTTEINTSETSAQEFDDGHGMMMFKYVDTEESSSTNADDETKMTTEEVASTNSNEIESTTVFDTDIMMNEQPVDAVSESEEAFIPYVEHVTKDKTTPPNNEKYKVTTYKPIPQKAQKDDTINDVKLKPHIVPNGGYPSNLVQQHPQKVKKENYTQYEDKWTKVEVISHLANSTPVAQHTSTNKPAPAGKPSVPESEPPGTQSSQPPPTEARPQYYSPPAVELHPAPQESLGLEASTANLVEDVQQFAELCNELAFKLWVSMTEKSVTAARSLVMSPFAITSLLAMIFLGAKGSTSGQMNDMLKLDDMMTFNPHQVFRNVTESVVQARNPGVRTAAFVRELYSDKGKGPLLEFYKQRASQFYDGLVEETNFTNIGDVLRRRTNLQVKKQTGGRVPEYLRGTSLSLQPPLAAFSANIFQTDCRGASTEGRDGEMYFTILPTTRQRRLVPIPSAVFKSGFLAGYEPGLDATVVSLGMQDASISTLFVMPGQQGVTAPGDGLSRLETRLLGTAYSHRAWSRLLRSLLLRPGLELQFPRFSHRSLLNLTSALQTMGLNELFDPSSADLQGLSGFTSPLHVSDLVQINTFTTCGEEVIGSRHHVEIYPSSPPRAGRDSEQDLSSVPLVSRPRQARIDPNLEPAEWEEADRTSRDSEHDVNGVPLVSRPRQARVEPSGFEEAVPQTGVYNMPLALRPRQARLPDAEQPLPRLKFDRPFLYFVRHNPTGFILHMGRFNPRLIH